MNNTRDFHWKLDLRNDGTDLTNFVYSVIQQKQFKRDRNTGTLSLWSSSRPIQICGCRGTFRQIADEVPHSVEEERAFAKEAALQISTPQSNQRPGQ